MINKKNSLLKKYKILFIEDSNCLLQLYHTLFQKHGQNFSFFAVQSGNEAIDLLQKDHFDLLITDLLHYGNSGIPFLEIISQKYPALPVIVCSGYGSIEKVEDAFRAGAQDYIIKPFHPLCLFQTINHILAGGKKGSCYLKQCLMIVCDHISYLLYPKCKSEWGLIGLKNLNLLSIEGCSDGLIKAYQITSPSYLTNIPEISEYFPMDRFTQVTIECIESQSVISLEFPSIRLIQPDNKIPIVNLSHLFCIPIPPHLPNIQCIHLLPHDLNLSVSPNWPIILQKVETLLTSFLRPLQYVP